ncbi:MAG: efflux RND transporter periplasmic adaptor subunit [Gemmatimonadales bacterium]|jgi:RND family efflux transporter MFP subunit
MKRFGFLFLLAVWQLASFTACAPSGGDTESEVRSDVQAVVGAKTAVAAVGPFTQFVSALGTVSPRPGSFAALGAPGPTRVARIFVVAGQAVQEGDALIEFDRAPFEAAARSAEAAVNVAQNARDRAVRLAEEGIVPRKDVDQANADLAQAQAALVGAQRAQAQATLHAPVSGVVTRMSAVMGSPADATAPLVEIADLSALDIMLSLTPADAARVHPGQRVAFWAGETAHGDSVGTGSVADVGAALDSATRAVEVRVRVGRTGRPLKIGEAVFGRIAAGVVPRAVTVPVAALVPQGEAFRVFVVDSAGIAHARDVTVGARTETLAEITSGLAGGETVVTYGAYGVSDSARIVPAKP